MKNSNIYWVCKDDREARGQEPRRKTPGGAAQKPGKMMLPRGVERKQSHHRAVSPAGVGEGSHVGDRYCVHCRSVQGT